MKSMTERYKDKRENFSTEQIASILEATGGILLAASDRLGVHRNTLSRWIKAEPALQEITYHVTESLLDVSEAGLIAALRKQERWAIEYYLNNKGKHRGYGLRAEITGPGGGPIQTQAVPAIDFSKLSTEEIEEYVRITEKASIQSGGGEAGAGEPASA